MGAAQSGAGTRSRSADTPPPEPRADYVHAAGLVSIVGGESTGKSTLALALAEELPALLVPETLREWVETHGRVPRPDEQREVMLAHAEAEAQLLRQAAAPDEADALRVQAGALGGSQDWVEGVSNSIAMRDGAPLPAESFGFPEGRSGRPPGSAGQAWVVSDSGPLMTAVYSILYYGDHSLVAEAVALAGRSELVVWCADDIPWVADTDQRDGPHMRAAAQDVLADLLVTSELPYLRVSGPLPERVAQVRRQLDGQASSPQ